MEIPKTLEEQLELFDKISPYIVDEVLSLMLAYEGEILEMARERLISGFKEYGSLMFEWDDIKRESAILEELADAVNYFVSGSVDY